MQYEFAGLLTKTQGLNPLRIRERFRPVANTRTNIAGEVLIPYESGSVSDSAF